ncbi:MAG: hypothetical protein JOY56_13550 [Solirubrobacterales bacterium]|nr:hypothetical protein [Solirubrobacterales bacterium]
MVTPNWSVQLPGGEYAGDDPNGFMPRDDIVRHLEGYATSFAAPVRERVEVTSLGAAAEGGFTLTMAMRATTKLARRSPSLLGARDPHPRDAGSRPV